MGRAPCCDKNGLKKGPWTPEEDLKLIDYIKKHGHGSWRTLPKNAGLDRCGKSCRLRWTNYLRPDIKRGRFSFEEEETIIQLHSVLGNKWSAIAARLSGRTDNEIKNYWNTHIRKRLLRMGIDPITHSPRIDLLDLSSLLNSSLYNTSQLNVSTLLGIQSGVNPELLRLATTLLSSQCQNQNQNQNPEFSSFPQNLQENQLYNPKFEDLQTEVQEHPVCTTSTRPCDTFLYETKIMKTNVEQYQSNPTFNLCCQSLQSTMWQDNVVPEELRGKFIPTTDQSSLIDSLFDVPSVLSTPSSSPTPLNSFSTYINSSTTEDEKDSFCSNIFKFEIPDALDTNDFLY
ncbi:hypothetical protein GIB67_023720 [Kingdonia uniflora]|uniref:Uncharacterized protein n=1 Tax=Kingdonia uniflora TaxID=39325 RepID=A0A7J7MG98_9MAGN|nr:hypothetical protein GIB67_023720 [Kingdonia uniflora]